MDKSGAMKVDTIQSMFESNQSNPDESWYKSKNIDTIYHGKTQDHRINLIWFYNLWFDSDMIRIKKSWIESNWHEHQGPRPENKNDTIQAILNQIKALEIKGFTPQKVLPQNETWHTKHFEEP